MPQQADVIQAVVAAPPDRWPAIIRAATAKHQPKPRPGTTKEAAKILAVHPRTVGRYAAIGLLHPIRISPRRIRFDLNEVEALATRGVEEGGRHEVR